MKRIVLPTIFRQIRKYHTKNIVPPGQRLTYLPPKTKPTQKSKNVTAIYFGSGKETQDDLRSEIYRQIGLDTYVASLPYNLVFSYDQKIQKDFARELVGVLESEGIREKVFCHVRGCHGFAFYKHFTKEIANHDRIKVIGCTMEDTPSNIYRSSLPLFYPIPPLNLIIRYIKYISESKGIEFAEKLDLTENEKMKSVTVIPDDTLNILKGFLLNFWKLGPNEWSGNYLLKRESDNWPIQFNYHVNESKFMDNLINVKRRQSSTRVVEGNKYHDVSSSESFDIFVEDVLDFFWECLEDKKKSLSTTIGHDKIKLYRHKPKP